ALDDDGRLIGHIDGHTGRRHHQDAIGVADRQLDALILGRRLIADALDFEALLVALGDALDHVGDEAARQAVQRARQSLVVGARPLHRLARLVHLDLDEAVIGEFELLPLGAFDEDLAIDDVDLDAGGDGYGLLADSRHFRSPYHTVQSNSPPSRCARAL